MRSWVHGVLARTPTDPSLHLAPAIPVRKLANARARCRVPEHEQVMGLIDCTVFGSAKHAVVFGDRLYICDRWTAALDGGIAVVEYSELAWLEITETAVQLQPGLEVPLRHFSRVTLQVLKGIREALGHVRAQRTPVGGDEVPAAIPGPTPREAYVAADGPDIGKDPNAIELQAAIAATPADEAPQLVLADLLLSAGDLRGELIILDQRERAGELTEPEALERLLLLAAEYSFPRVPAEEATLPFIGYGSAPPRYYVEHARHQYDARYRDFRLYLTVDGAAGPSYHLPLERPHAFTIDETIVILRLLSDAIRAGSPLETLEFPFGREALPVYDGGPLRGYRLPASFTAPRMIAPVRYGLAARDYTRWMSIWARLAEQPK